LGLNFDEQDQFLFDQFEETWAADPKVIAQAKNNEFEQFRLVFDRMFLGNFVDRMDCNEAIWFDSFCYRVLSLFVKTSWWGRWGSNPRPRDYESPALTD
jgi:hypothetical protein